MTATNQTLKAIRGMNDLLPQEAYLWEIFENTAQSILRSYGYAQIRTPIVEMTQLFQRGIGEVTDIVEKEMYSFVDSMNGEHLSLRPEGTAGVVRAVIEHHLTYDKPQRLWYTGPMFRHERPQRGRYRQFHQIGVEAIGFTGPDIDAELIILCKRLWDDLGLRGIQLELNSIGDLAERQAHRADLLTYFLKHQDALDEDSQRRLHTNPLRILDSKNPTMQSLLEQAPQLVHYLGEASLAHFERLQQLLHANAIPFIINPRLVRGLDYYNRSVFEWTTDQLGAQATICGGGRYDPLVSMLGGKETPAAGFAIGMERVIELLKMQGQQTEIAQCDIYVVHQGQAAEIMAFNLAEQLRDQDFAVIVDCASNQAGRSFKAQMKRADNAGAAFALILGDNEIEQAMVTLKNLRQTVQEIDNQKQIALTEVVKYLTNLIEVHTHE